MDSFIQSAVAGAFEWHIALGVDSDYFAHLHDCSYITVIPPLPWRFLTGERVAAA